MMLKLSALQNFSLLCCSVLVSASLYAAERPAASEQLSLQDELKIKDAEFLTLIQASVINCQAIRVRIAAMPASKARQRRAELSNRRSLGEKAVKLPNHKTEPRQAPKANITGVFCTALMLPSSTTVSR